MSKIKQHWWNPFDPYSRRNVGKKGKRDGTSSPPIPSWAARTLPPFLREVRRAGQMDAQLLARTWAKEDAELKASWRAAHLERRQARTARDRAKATRNRARSRYEEKHGTPAPETMSRVVLAYPLLLVVLLVVELPVNGAAFQLFGESLLFALLGAGLVAAILLPSAHYLGGLLRNTSSWTWQRGLFGGLLAVVPVGVIGAASHLRRAYAGYLRASDHASGLIYLGDEALFWSFALFNLGLFVVATYAAYYTHPKWLREVRRADKQLDRMRSRYESKDAACTAAATARALAFEKKQAELGHVQEAVWRLGERYRDQNLVHRTDRDEVRSHVIDSNEHSGSSSEGSAYPRSYEAALTLEVPPGLRELDWSLDDAPASAAALRNTPRDSAALAKEAVEPEAPLGSPSNGYDSRSEPG